MNNIKELLFLSLGGVAGFYLTQYLINNKNYSDMFGDNLIPLYGSIFAVGLIPLKGSIPQSILKGISITGGSMLIGNTIQELSKNKE